MTRCVTKVLVCLDVTPKVADEAKRLGVELIISHHPLMFRPIQRIREEDYEGAIISELIRAGISLISAHTNLDQSMTYSGSAVLANSLNLANTRWQGFIVAGELPDAPITAKELRERIAAIEGEFVYQYGPESAAITTLAICGGAFDEGFQEAISMGAQAYLTGEVRHHNALTAMGSNIILYQGGHLGTEQVLVKPLANALQKRMNELKYNICVYPSECYSYGSRGTY